MYEILNEIFKTVVDRFGVKELSGDRVETNFRLWKIGWNSWALVPEARCREPRNRSVEMAGGFHTQGGRPPFANQPSLPRVYVLISIRVDIPVSNHR